MRIDASYTYPAAPAQVWARLLDPESLRACIPGCEALESIGPDRWNARLSVGAGPIRGTYTGAVAITGKREPMSYTLEVEGRGSPGFVKGSAQVTLVPDGVGTRVDVVADGQVGGTVAAVGQRMLTGVARSLMGQFFDCLRSRL
ncbi:MAG TPA: carbon monoxide dehydrogenase subunit G [Candidatus Limnocylindria bacterium]|nr:carbon monoxide dehydrogenase subunit G [Candidatus Limnocylindria bacterium]